MATAKLSFEGKQYTLPVVIGSEGEQAVDIRALRSDSKLITLDPGYGNTGSCESSICFIDGDRGILRYRGYPIEQLATRALHRGLLPADPRAAAERRVRS